MCSADLMEVLLEEEDMKNLNTQTLVASPSQFDLDDLLRHHRIAGTSLEPFCTICVWKLSQRTQLIAGSNGKKQKGLDNPQPSS